MVAGEREPSATPLGGPAYDIGIWPVMLDKIHVYGGEMVKRMAEVPDQGHGLEEYFREQHSGAEIDVNAAFEFRHK